MGEEEKRLGRIYPFCYKQYHDESGEALGDLLRVYGEQVIWLLDIRFNPEDSWGEFRGSALNHMRPSQYRHAKGLGLVNGQLYYPSSAVRKILLLLQESESFVIFSGDFDHVNVVEALIRDEAGKQGLLLEDPCTLHAGDLCIWQKREANAPQIEVVLHHRTPNVYVFLGHIHHTEVSNEYVDICDLTLVEKGAYLCEECKKGVETTKWRDQAEKKLCAHCFWLRDLKYGK